MAKRKKATEHLEKETTSSQDKAVFFAYEKLEDFNRPPFGKEAQEECAELLRRLQKGQHLVMPQSRPMPSIGAGCHELRVRDAKVNWRLMYFLDEDAVIVLLIFIKKTEKTPGDVIKLCSARLKRYQAVRLSVEQQKKKK